MPSSAASRPRLTPAAAFAIAMAAVVAGALAAAPLLLQPDEDALRPLTALLAILGVGATAVGLVARAPSWGMFGAACFGAELVSTLYDHPSRVDAQTPITAAGLLLLCELIAWAAEARDGATVIPPARRQLPKPAILVLVAVAAWTSTTALAALAATVAIGRDLAVAALGAIAIAVLATALVTSTRRRA